MAEFQPGLFSQVPSNSTARSGVPQGNDPTSFLMNSASRAVTKTDGNVFDTFTKPIRRRQREKVVAEATSIGLTPDDPKFYEFTSKKLQEIGDSQGAEIAVNRGLQLKGQIATARKSTADAARTERIVEEDLDTRGVKVREGTLDATRDRTEVMREELALKETPEERRNREESIARISAAATRDAALIRERAATSAALLKEGVTGEDIKTSDVTIASNALMGEIYRHADLDGSVTNDNFMQLWGDFAGQDMEKVLKQARSTVPAKRAEAERVLASMAQAVAINEKILKKDFPRMSQQRRLDLAVAMGPNGARVLQDPSSGVIRLVTPDGAVLEEVP